MPFNRFMEGPAGAYPVNPAAGITRMARAHYNAARMGEPSVIDAYWYTTPIRALAASGSDLFSIPVQEDAEFVAEWVSGIIAQDVAGVIEWRLGTGATQNATDGITNVVASVRITDTGSNRQMMDRFTYWHNVIGTAQRPSYLPAPKHFRPNSNIQIEVTNLTATAAQWQITFGGVKIYKVGRT